MGYYRNAEYALSKRIRGARGYGFHRFMDLMNIRPWIFFYLICFVALLLATTFIVQGITPLFWMASTLIIVVVGFNFILIFNEVKEHKKRKALMKKLSSTAANGNPGEKGKN